MAHFLSVVVFLFCAELMFAADPIAERDAIVTRIVRAGGRFDFDSKKPSRPPIRLNYTHDSRDATKNKPSRFDIAALDSLKEVHVTLLGPRDLDIEWVTSLPNLVELECRHITRFTSVTAESLNLLKNCTRLEILVLSGLPITDDHIAGLGELSRLARLDLSRTNVTDKGLASLKTCRSLNALSVDGANVSGTGFEELKSLPKLETVELGGDRVTNDSVASLVGCSEIKQLSISSDALTDGVIRYIERMPNLKQLRISGSASLTADGVKSLQRKKPRLQFVR